MRSKGRCDTESLEAYGSCSCLPNLQPVQWRPASPKIGPKTLLPTRVESLEPERCPRRQCHRAKVGAMEAVDAKAVGLDDGGVRVADGRCSQSSSHSRWESWSLGPVSDSSMIWHPWSVIWSIDINCMVSWRIWETVGTWKEDVERTPRPTIGRNVCHQLSEQ
jgi:hypothetical protein